MPRSPRLPSWWFSPAVADRVLVSRNLNSAVIFKRFCADRLFDILEKIQIHGDRWRQSDSRRDDEIPIIDALRGKSHKEQGGVLAPI